MTEKNPEEELQKRYNLFGPETLEQSTEASRISADEINTILITKQSTVWASLTPEDIDLIVNLVVKRMKDNE